MTQPTINSNNAQRRAFRSPLCRIYPYRLPYNTGHDFVYEDDFKDPIAHYLEVTSQATKSNPETMGRFHTAWLNLMYPRLRLAANLLRDDGVIFISIDDNEVHNLRKLCDEVFGEENFVATIVWKHTQQSKNDERHFSRQYNYNVVYAKNATALPNFYFERTEEDNKNYSNPDNDPKGLWRSGDVRSPNYRKTLCFNIIAPNGEIIKAPENGWRWSEDSINEKIKTGEIIFKKDFSGIVRKIYLSDQSGRTPENLWMGDRFGTTRQATAVIKDLFNGVQVFDTPKPKEVVMQMLEVATNPTDNDIILDFFSGSATTAHAVMQLNAEDGGNRRFICVQIPEMTNEKSEAYKAGYKNICEIGKERIRRAGAKLTESDGQLQIGKEKPPLDTGFKVFKLDSSNLKEWDGIPVGVGNLQTYIRKMRDVIDGVKDGRPPIDVIYELMLKLGITLTTEIVVKDIMGKVVYSVDGDLLLFTLDPDITAEFIEAMAELAPAKIIVAEMGFVDDTAMANAHYTLKDLGIEIKLV